MVARAGTTSRGRKVVSCKTFKDCRWVVHAVHVYVQVVVAGFLLERRQPVRAADVMPITINPLLHADPCTCWV